jgi:15-cis-phytoene synthase
LTPDQYCEQKAAASGSSFYYAFRFLPPPRRLAITALYAFCREVDDVVDEIHDTNVAKTKLQYWRNEVRAMRTGVVSHPVAKALLVHAKAFELEEQDFLTIIDGMQMDLERTRYTTWAELTEYCHRVAGVVGLMSAKIFGYTDQKTKDYAHSLGLAFQLTNIIRDVGEDARRGRIYIPLEDLAAYRVNPSELLRANPGEGFRSLMAMQTARARDLYAQAFEELPAADKKAQRPGLIMAAIYERILNEIEAKKYPVLHERVSISPLTKLFLALKVWLRA